MANQHKEYEEYGEYGEYEEYEEHKEHHEEHHEAVIDLTKIKDTPKEALQEQSNALMLNISTPPLAIWDDSRAKVMRSIANQVEALQQTLPLNADGLASCYINPSVIAEQATLELFEEGQLSVEILRNAVVSLEYPDGFPVVEGRPFWERLDGEEIDYYDLFKLYREEKYLLGTRSLSRVAERSGLSYRVINTLSKMYHWRARVRCYDKYKAFEIEVARQRMISKMESKHFTAAEELFDMCTEYIKKNKELLTPKEAREWFETAVKLQRMSLGISPDKPAGSELPAKGPLIAVNNINNSVTNTQVNAEQSTEDLNEILRVLVSAGALKVPTSTIDADPSREPQNLDDPYAELRPNDTIEVDFKVIPGSN